MSLTIEEKYKINPNCKKCLGKGNLGLRMEFREGKWEPTEEKIPCPSCQRTEVKV